MGASDMKPVRVPRGDGTFTLIEKKSKFIAVLYAVDGERDALERLDRVRASHREANHNVYAYRLIEGQLMRYSDDGEPQGTAGMPVLEVLRREDVHNVLCVVTRYFGGTLLGAGGLVRAYAASAKGALDNAGITVLRPLAEGTACVPYPLWEQAERLIGSFETRVTDVSYTDNVTVRFLLPEEQRGALEAELIELTAGRVVPEWLGVALGSI